METEDGATAVVTALSITSMPAPSSRDLAVSAWRVATSFPARSREASE
jgi:hypothetical protein